MTCQSCPGTFDFRGSASRHCRGASKAGLSHPADYSRFLKLCNPCRNYPGPEPENFPYFAPFFPGYPPDSCYNGIIKSANSKLTSVSPFDRDSALFFPSPGSGLYQEFGANIRHPSGCLISILAILHANLFRFLSFFLSYPSLSRNSRRFLVPCIFVCYDFYVRNFFTGIFQNSRNTIKSSKARTADFFPRYGSRAGSTPAGHRRCLISR